MKKIVLTFLKMMVIFSVSAKTYYLHPTNGNLSNLGTEASPLPSLEEVLASSLFHYQKYTTPYDSGSSLVDVNPDGIIGAGDTLILMDGHHGSCNVINTQFSSPITIIGKNKDKAIIKTINIKSGSHWIFQGLTISSEPYGEYLTSPIVFFETHGWQGPAKNILIKDCFLYSTIDNTLWKVDDWLAKSRDGIRITGNDIEVRDCHMLNVNFGISLVGSNLTARGNTIEYFSADGMRTLGKNHLIERNVIKNCVKINDNHDDGIQSFNLGTHDTRDGIIRENVILNYEDPHQPLLGTLQGIGFFDGPYHNYTIENNIISVDHWHGISLYGAYDCKITNNTVIDITPDSDIGPSWIRINPNKDGTPSERNTVANNISNNLVLTGSVESNNIILNSISEYEANFVDYSLYNFGLLSGSIAIDAAIDSLAPTRDIYGTIRPQGLHSDAGAIEYLSPLKSEEIDPTASITVFPNPSPGIIYISNDTEHIQVYDLEGRLQFAGDSPNGIFDLSTLNAGLYVIYTNDGHTTKLVINH